jgi:hypothetical protein
MDVTQYSKAWAALVMAILAIIELHWGFNLGIGEDTVLIIIVLLTPLFVWLIPNSD